MSGHKIHGPKGVGMLYMRKGLKVKPLMLGGGQQRGQRPVRKTVPVRRHWAWRVTKPSRA